MRAWLKLLGTIGCCAGMGYFIWVTDAGNIAYSKVVSTAINVHGILLAIMAMVMILLMAMFFPILLSAEQKKQRSFRKFSKSQKPIEPGIWKFSNNQYLVSFSDDTQQLIDWPTLEEAKQYLRAKQRYRDYIKHHPPIEAGIWNPEEDFFVIYWEQDTDIQIWNDLRSAQRAYSSRVSQNWSLEKARSILKLYPPALGLSTVFLLLDYWRPAIWWNTSGALAWRHFFGEQGAILLGYALPLLILGSFTFLAIKAVKKIGLSQVFKTD